MVAAAGAGGGGELADLIATGALKPPVQLMRTHKGKELSATILPGGRVRVGKDEFDSVSTAAVAAMKLATGVERTVNGWVFWQVPTAEGKRVALATFRGGTQVGGRATGS